MRFLFLALLLFCAPLASAPLSLAELVDIALKNNPETAQAWANVKRAQAAKGVAKSSYFPSLDGSGGVEHGREVKFPNGPDTNYTVYSGELTLSYLLYDFGERTAEVDATKEALKAANWSSDFTMQQVIYKVASSYYEYLDARQALAVKECSLQDAKFILDSAEDLHQVGLRCKTDLSTSKAEVAQVELDLAQQRAQVAISYAKLLTNLGLSVQETIDVKADPEAMQTSLFSEGAAQLLLMADEQRADLLAKKATLAEMRQRVKVASRAALPKLRALGQTGWLQYTKHEGSGYNYKAGVAVDIPLFRGFEFTFRKRLALAEEELTAAELNELRQEIALEVLTYCETVKAAKESLKWTDQYLEEAESSYDYAVESYKAGLHSVFDLLQSRRMLADARLKKAEVNTQWLVSLAQLAFATGSIK